MICPTCNGNLSQVSIEEIQLDVCKEGCGGIWFDNFELKKMDEPHEFTDENLLELLAENFRIEHDQSKKRNCPKCQDVVMMRNFFSIKQEVEIDHCPKCAGYWLDEGELYQIRNQYKTEEERRSAAISYFGEIFDGELSEAKETTQEEARKRQKVSNMFRLITPSYYLAKTKN
jgi:Zn-finger nucleic acid-binding protein